MHFSLFLLNDLSLQESEIYVGRTFIFILRPYPNSYHGAQVQGIFIKHMHDFLQIMV